MDERPKRPNAPEPLACSCGIVLPWQWWSGTDRMTARWTAPKIDPCAECAESSPRQAVREVRDRLQAAGFPAGAIGFRLGSVLEQSDAQKEEAFQRSVRALFGQRMGVLACNRQALVAARSWRPDRWAVVHGPVGVGKTTLLTALAWKLAQAPEHNWEEVTGADRARRLVRVRRVPIHYVRVSDVMGRQSAALAERSGVLFLDDVGVNDPAPHEERRVVGDLLCRRADAGLATVIAATDHGQLLDAPALYGTRVADRLRSALSIGLSGPSWRGGSTSR